MRNYGREPNMNFVRVILAADIERGAWFGHRAQPIFAGRVGHVLGQLDDGFTGAALAAE
jgi:hypothetical protein